MVTSVGYTELGLENRDEVVSLLSDAFRSYPVMRFVLGEGETYEERLAMLIGFFIEARRLRGEPVLGVRGARGLSAAALVSFSDVKSPPELAVLREKAWDDLGDDARARYEAFGDAVPTFNTSGHVHLNMLGVAISSRGQGLGRTLLDAVHNLSSQRVSSSGVSLTTEQGANVPLYEHFGYTVKGSAQVNGAFTTWAMYRADHPRA